MDVSVTPLLAVSRRGKVVARCQAHLDASGIDSIFADWRVARAMHISRCHDGFDRSVRPEPRNDFVGAEHDRPLWAQIVQLRMAAGDKALRFERCVQVQL